MTLKIVLCLAVLSIPGRAQQPVQSLRGVVRNAAGNPLGGAEVTVGERRATSDVRGVFRVDSLQPGRYNITIRMVGYSPLRSRVAVAATVATVVEYSLNPAPYLLPTLLSEARRTGIYGSVGDTGYRAIVGAKVQLEGWNGGEMRTDSMGRFSFPRAAGGHYMVRVTFPGHTERRLVVDLKRGEGQELAVRLAPFSGGGGVSRADEVAVHDLGKRLNFGLRRERLTAKQLERYGSLPLCDLPVIRAEVGRDPNVGIAFSLNGVTADTEAEINRVCAWRADEVALVEFGPDACKDVTTTLQSLFGPWCSGRSRNVLRSLAGGGRRVGSQRAGQGYVIIWERR